MFPSGYWYPVLAETAVSKKPRQIERFGTKLVVWRGQDGRVGVLRDLCPHMGSVLSTGRVVDGNIECPFHGIQFDVDGRCRRMPVNGKDSPCPKAFGPDRYPIAIKDGMVWLWYGDVPASGLPAIESYEDLGDEDYVRVGREVSGAAPFEVMMASNLDFGHFAFVHRSLRVLFPGSGPRCQECTTTVEGNRVRVDVNFAPDDGKSHKGLDANCTVLFPAVAVYVTPNAPATTVIYACPIDERRTWGYAASYIKRGPGQFFKTLGARIFGRTLLPIQQKQDHRIWSKLEDVPMRLVLKSDAGVAAYHKMYRKALETPRRLPVLVADKLRAAVGE